MFAGANYSHTTSWEVAELLKARGWKVIRVSTRQNKILRVLDMLGTIWSARHEYAVAHVDVYSGDAFIWAEIVCYMLRILRKTYFLTLQGGNLPVFSARNSSRVKNLFRNAAGITAPSGYLKEELSRYYSGTIKVIPNAIPVDRYISRLRKPASPRLVWVRAFHHIYNPSLAVRSLALLTADFPDIKLTMVGADKGDGSMQEAQDLTKRLNLQDFIQISEGIPHEHVPELLNKADIFLNTTNIDNNPLSVKEAMASGLCIVCTSVGGIPYLLEQSQDALLVPPDDEKQMAAAIRRILTDTELAGRISSKARAKAEQHDWKNILPQWEKILDYSGA